MRAQVAQKPPRTATELEGGSHRPDIEGHRIQRMDKLAHLFEAGAEVEVRVQPLFRPRLPSFPQWSEGGVPERVALGPEPGNSGQPSA